ncbi:MAG: SpoIIE family protein phosphatase [Bdellovibrionales bacterium]|nr:SpoIIE family protein phosphatase [Bdellovibrionales bacterium]
MKQDRIKVGVHGRELMEGVALVAEGMSVDVSLADGEPGSFDILIGDDGAIDGAYHSLSGGRRPSLFVTVEDGTAVPETFQKGYADDLVVVPLRRLDVLRLVRLHHNLESLRGLQAEGALLPRLIHRLEEDVKMAGKIQRLLIRDRFPPIGNIPVASKYWCGMRSGGDYFDLLEFPDGAHTGIFLSDSSSYGLSGKLLSALVHFTAHGTKESALEPAALVEILGGKLRAEIKPEDQLSIFYGILNRKTMLLSYVWAGTPQAWVERAGRWQCLADGSRPSLAATGWHVESTGHFQLEAGDRFLLVSDGWSEGAGIPVGRILGDAGAGMDSRDFVNEMAFRVKRNISRDDDEAMPPQDCSLILLDLPRNTLRLAQ